MSKSKHQVRNTSNAPASQESKIDGDFYSLKFSVDKSIRYHGKRRRFFDAWHNIANALAALTGSSSFIAIYSGNNEIAKYCSAVVACATSLDLVMGFSSKAQLHNELQKKFSALLNEMILEDLTEDTLKKWNAERVSIEKDEPTSLTLLVDICHNEVAIAMGHHNYVLANICEWRRKLSHFFSFDGYHQKLAHNQHPLQSSAE